MNEFGIDIELLIQVIRDKPNIWDNTCEFYKDKSYSQDSWNDICTAFQPDFHSLRPEEQHKLKSSLKKKWASVQESWIKWKKESAQKIDPDKTFTDSEIAAFLRNILFNGESECNCLNDNCNISEDKNQELPIEIESPVDPPTNATDSINFRKLFSKKKPSKRKASDYDNDVPHSSTVTPSKTLDNSSQHRMFFEGIMSSVEDFSEHEILDFHIGVLNVIRDIRTNRNKIL
ncbi:hypothetical protein JTE90_006835 [Oedothorax gibbosus]|uniref:MADF domain-containing protein n=1 Tax=Oedothorax gibbosus TaxID=931172 RepID=A0AAV6TWD9_9ARAC|nr:hypothetical protein JTE90_006835 [Oedothorax gibbosus]